MGSKQAHLGMTGRFYSWVTFAAWLFAKAALASQPVPVEQHSWAPIDQLPAGRSLSDMRIKPQNFRLFQLDHNRLRPQLQAAPKAQAMRARESSSIISLPMPDGSLSRFRLVESPVMEPELAARYPEIRTYAAQAVDEPGTSARLDFTPAGFHAQILSSHGAVYIDPALAGDTNTYASYHKRDLLRNASDFQCLARGTEDGTTAGVSEPGATVAAQAVSSPGLRTYRLACAATAEYTRFQGGTVSAGLAAIVTAINRVSGVYEAEAGIRLVLVANNDLLVYTNAASDPYHLANATQLLSLNQSNLDRLIGNDRYDVGHVFSTVGGGLAGVGVACVAGAKAAGETGMAAPVGDAFYIDYVAHELGHQFGAHHTFNSSASACGGGNRNASTAFEPGSGSTIMSYAGICGSDNLQVHSDPYFHSATLEEINAFTTAGAGKNVAFTAWPNSVLPAVSEGALYTIPMGTPFSLTAQVSNPSEDRLTYCWEERDLGPAANLAAGDNGNSPLFRSYSPSTNAARTFPRLEDLLNHVEGDGECLPSTARTLNFRVTVRDTTLGGGIFCSAEAQVAVMTNAGPFVVTSPTTPVTWSNVQVVTWSVAGTTNAPLNVAGVNILLSTNGGLTFPLLLASNVPNSGFQPVILPSLASSACRIKVEAVGNIFFAISPTNFNLAPYVGDVYSLTLPVVNTQSFANTTPIVIRDRTNALPYPSAIQLNNLPGVVTHVSVTLHGLKHARPADLDILLVSPSGKSVLLMSDAGTNVAVTNLTLTFDDAATNCLRRFRRLTSGTFQPSNYDVNSDKFPAPAPAGPYGQKLSVLNGQSANGTWALFVRDDAAKCTGSIAGGWSLSIVTSNSISAAEYAVGGDFAVSSRGPATNASSGTQSQLTSPQRPVISSMAISNNRVVLTWDAVAGRNYRVEYRDSLSETNWTPLAPDVQANGAVGEASDQSGLVPQRFYRIRVLP